MAAQATHIILVLGMYMAHWHQNGFRGIYRLWASVLTSVVTFMGQRHKHSPRLQQDHGIHHGPQWQHEPWTLTWPQVAVQATNTNMAADSISIACVATEGQKDVCVLCCSLKSC